MAPPKSMMRFVGCPAHSTASPEVSQPCTASRPGFLSARAVPCRRVTPPDLRATVQTARDIGLRSISFLAADLDSTAFNRPVAWPADRQSSLAPELAELERRDRIVDRRVPCRRLHSGSPAKTASHRLAFPRPPRTGALHRTTLQRALGLRRSRIQRRRPSVLLSPGNRKHRRHDSARGVERAAGHRVPRESAGGGQPNLPALRMFAIRSSRSSPGRVEPRGGPRRTTKFPGNFTLKMLSIL